MNTVQRLPFSILFSLLVAVIALVITLPTQAKEPYAIPEFTQSSAQEWLNSKPLTKKICLER